MTGCFLHQLRSFDAAPLLRVPTASVKAASGRDVDRAGKISLQANAFRRARPAPGRHRRQQRPRVRMAGIAKQHLAVRLLHHHAEVHDGNLVADVLHHRQIVRDEQERQVQILLQVAQQVQDLGLNRDIQRRDGFVADDEVGLQRQCPGDADALALAARELMGEQVPLVGTQPHQREQLRDPFLAFRGAALLLHVERTPDDVAGRLAGVERRVRVLKDDLHPAAYVEQRLAFQ